MTAKPSYEELEKLVTSLTQEIESCRNLQRYLHQAEEYTRKTHKREIQNTKQKMQIKTMHTKH